MSRGCLRICVRGIGDIRQRIGSEIHPMQVKHAMDGVRRQLQSPDTVVDAGQDGLVDNDDVHFLGDMRWWHYREVHERAIGQKAPYRQ